MFWGQRNFSGIHFANVYKFYVITNKMRELGKCINIRIHLCTSFYYILRIISQLIPSILFCFQEEMKAVCKDNFMNKPMRKTLYSHRTITKLCTNFIICNIQKISTFIHFFIRFYTFISRTHAEFSANVRHTKPTATRRLLSSKYSRTGVTTTRAVVPATGVALRLPAGRVYPAPIRNLTT